MEVHQKTGTLQIRIGVLQHEDEMTFKATRPFTGYDLANHKIFEGKPEHSYKITHKTQDSGEIRYAVRMNIRVEPHEADERIQFWASQGVQATKLRVGQEIPLGNGRVYDNREFWVLSRTFDSETAADEYRRTLPDFGGMKVVPIITRAARGELFLEGVSVENGLRLVPDDPSGRFLLDNIHVGIGFHWDHRETQEYEGDLAFHIDRTGKITAVTILDLETYLAAVNSSEMVPNCSMEFLKSQTIVARNTVFATAGKHHFGDPFDLCADDHCQCFHGSAAIEDRSREAASLTRGEVLMYGDQVCDARYAKVCGGIGESYQNVWDDQDVPYLTPFYDGPETPVRLPDLRQEEAVRDFIESSPRVFCNPDAYRLPDYLREAHEHFNWQVGYMPEKSGFRWEVRFTPEELGQIVEEKTGWGLGAILDIQPLERGDSGRLIYARLVGQNGEKIIGKELEIRRVLSKTHLFSSLFVVDKETDANGKLKTLSLKGGGWGHGVGLCQVGAEIMGEQGYAYTDILYHYYPGSKLKKLYA
ncbi:MAG: SpoIID/LytB domain-containing protein [Calditrichaeota bacterium]|nr:SpoIID/LytB domain-containing protein [Calditrichota bacterium]